MRPYVSTPRDGINRADLSPGLGMLLIAETLASPIITSYTPAVTVYVGMSQKFQATARQRIIEELKE